MRKIALIFFTLSLILLSGCTRARGLDEKLITRGIGIDFKDDQYKVSIQALSNIGGSSEEEGEGDDTFIISSSDGSLASAVRGIEKQTGKEVLYSHTLVLIIGKEAAETKLNDIIDFFTKGYKLRPAVETLIAKEEALAILEEKQADEIWDVARLDPIKSNLRYFAGDLQNNYKGAKTWLLEISDGSLQCIETVLFKQYKWIGVLDKKDTKSLVILSGSAKNLVVEGDYIIKKSKANIKVDLSGEVPHFSITVNLKVDYDVDDSNKISEIVKKMIEETIYKIVWEYECDIFNFHKYIMNKDLQYFKDNESFIYDILKKSIYDVKVEVKTEYAERPFSDSII